eukprot:1510747-Rhodomonas_salina.2
MQRLGSTGGMIGGSCDEPHETDPSLVGGINHEASLMVLGIAQDGEDDEAQQPGALEPSVHGTASSQE